MKLSTILTVSAVAISLVTQSSNALAQNILTPLSNLGQSFWNWNDVDSADPIESAVAFTTGSQPTLLVSVSLPLQSDNSVETSFSASIYSNVNGNPGAALAALTAPAGDISAAKENIYIFTAPNTLLQTNTTYWIVAKDSDATDPGGYLWGGTGSTLVDSGSADLGWQMGASKASLNRGSTWVANTENSQFSVQVTLAPTVWHGGVNTNWDIGSTTNWLLGGNPAVYSNNVPVQFDDTALRTNVFITAIVFPGDIFVTNNLLDYTFTSSVPTAIGIDGTNGLTKSGTNLLTLANGNGYSGGTVINAGTVQLNLPTAAGTGTISVATNATLNLYLSGGSFNTGGSINNVISGAGVINVLAGAYTTMSFNGSLANFTGVMNLPGGGNGKTDITSGNINVNRNAIINITNGGTLYIANATVPASINVSGTGNYENLGALRVDGDGIVSGPVTLLGNATVGSAQASGIISGAIGDGGHGFSLTRVGGGTIGTILTGTNTYSGSTIISDGFIALSGNGSIANSTNISIGANMTFDVSGLNSTFQLGANQTLTGNGAAGVIQGNVNANAGTLALTYTNGLPTLNIANGVLTLNNNAVTVTVNGPALAAGIYPVIAAGTGGAVSGSVDNSTLLVNGSGVSDSLPTQLVLINGNLDLVVGTTTPPPVNITPFGNQIILSWPVAFTGGILQTNSDLSTMNWANYPATISSSNTVNFIPTAGQLFFRLTLQTSGSLTSPDPGGWNRIKNN